MRNPTVVLITLGYSLCIGSAGAQLVSVGVKGGISITEPGRYNDESKRYIVGPSVEFRLPFRFAAEIDALYARTGTSTRFLYTDPAGIAGTTTDIRSRTRGNSWEFPVLGKYYFTSREHTVQPFVGTGYTLSTTWVHNDMQISVLSPNPIATTPVTTTSGNYRTPFDVGAVVAAGVRVKAGRFSVLPEIRYTHFGATSTASRKNQAKFLLGISF